jgi:hypothetical protein
MTAPCPTFGFVVRMDVARGADPGAVVAAFVSEFVAPHGLVCERVAGPQLHFVVTGEGTQAADADRLAALTWLESRHDVTRSQVGPLVDVGDSA